MTQSHSGEVIDITPESPETSIDLSPRGPGEGEDGDFSGWWAPCDRPQAVANLVWSEGEEDWTGRQISGGEMGTVRVQGPGKTGGKPQKVYMRQKGAKQGPGRPLETRFEFKGHQRGEKVERGEPMATGGAGLATEKGGRSGNRWSERQEKNQNQGVEAGWEGEEGRQ